MDPSAGACCAPRSALYLRPDGWVTACCTTWHLLGRVTGPERQSLAEIWEGAAAEAQRAAISQHDYSLGCWECGHAAERGARAAGPAAGYDDLLDVADDGMPALIDFAMSNRCNLQCVMCNGGLSSTIREVREGRPPMPPAYDDRFFEELDPFLRHLKRAVFKGGEPFLVREHRRVWERMIELGVRPAIRVSTNGTVFTPEVERLVETLKMNVTVSVDAMDPAVLAAVRVGVDPDRLWRNIDRFQEIGQRTGEPVTLAFCFMAETWGELVPFLQEVDRRGTGAELIVVDGPKSFAVAGLPAEELERVRSHLADAADRVDLRPASTALLHDALAAVTAAIGRRSEAPAQAVSIGLGADPVGTRRSELRRLSGADPLELTYRNEVVVGVTEPAWAARLQPQQWVGTGLEQMITVLTTAVGSPLRSDIDALEGGVHRCEFRYGDGAQEEVLLAYYVPPAADPEQSAILLVPVGAG